MTTRASIPITDMEIDAAFMERGEPTKILRALAEGLSAARARHGGTWTVSEEYEHDLSLYKHARYEFDVDGPGWVERIADAITTDLITRGATEISWAPGIITGDVFCERIQNRGLGMAVRLTTCAGLDRARFQADLIYR